MPQYPEIFVSGFQSSPDNKASGEWITIFLASRSGYPETEYVTTVASVLENRAWRLTNVFSTQTRFHQLSASCKLQKARPFLFICQNDVFYKTTKLFKFTPGAVLVKLSPGRKVQKYSTFWLDSQNIQTILTVFLKTCECIFFTLLIAIIFIMAAARSFYFQIFKV